jgi:RHS repeat-associated protein
LALLERRRAIRTAANANNAGNNSTTNRVNVEVFYIHADHLGTPRVVTRSTVATGANAPSSSTPTSPGAINKAVWTWNSDPFGTSIDNSKPTENPQIISGTATVQQAAAFTQNLRFIGNIADAESGKDQNYYRERDKNSGRYLQSDPIGLRGGYNTFSHVLNQPMAVSDRKGLAPDDCKCTNITYRGLDADPLKIIADLNGKETDGDIYGHWWYELHDKGRSYGWWPCGDGSNVSGRPGCLNLGGRQDPKYGKAGDWSANPYARAKPNQCEDCKAVCKRASDCLQKFGEGYRGNWSLTRSCRDFVTESLSACNLYLRVKEVYESR